jgi:hypothetical protein
MRKPLLVGYLLCIGSMLAIAVGAERIQPTSDGVSEETKQKFEELNRRVEKAYRECDSKAGRWGRCWDRTSAPPRGPMS